MNFNDLDEVAQSGAAKYTLCKTQLPRYFTRAALAGFYLALATFSSHVCSALLADSSPTVGKLIGAAVFGIGLVCIIMLGGELFTGNNFVLTAAALERRVTPLGVARVWLWSYLGNLFGSVVLCSVFALGGSMSALLSPYLSEMMGAKLALSVPQLIFRGIACNFVVCVAVLTGIKVKDASAKILIVGALIFTFVISGLEHSVANMSLFTLSMWMVPGMSLAAALRNLLWVTLGNILGGSMLLAVPFWHACGKSTADKSA